MTISRVLIVGASLGGLRTAEQLRARGYSGEIMVVGEEPHTPYNRPPLSKDFLTGQVDAESIGLRSARQLDPIEWRLGQPVVSADLAGHVVTLADGAQIAYDVLVVSTGVRPRHMPALARLHNVVSLRTRDDSAHLREALRTRPRLVVVGSGFIGCEVAASARKLGCEVTVVSRCALPLESAIGSGLAGRILERHTTAGVSFLLEDRVSSCEQDDATVTRVNLASGQSVDCDLVLEAIGCVPNVEWLEGNDVDVSDGLLCDSTMAVLGAENVFAVGDVARFPNARFDAVPRRVEHWNIAVESARRAASAIASIGNETALPPFAPLPAFWSNQYDIRLQAYGLPRVADRIVELDEELGGAPISAYYRGDDLVAVAALNNGPSLLALAQKIDPRVESANGARPVYAAN